jgi:uncharacterized iron-regulated protein
MQTRRFWIGVWGAIGAIVLLVSSVNASGFSAAQQGILQSLRSANVVYLGELHNSDSDHQDQLAIVQDLKQAGDMAIGLEMFQRPDQGAIDRYLAGELSEAELQTQTEFQKRWGWPWESYAPLLRWAKAQKVPVIALNVPTEITRKVSRQGLESLKGDELKNIVPIAEIDFSNTTYRDLILQSYRQHRQNATAQSKSFERFYATQLLWDETMAATAANFYRQFPQRRLVVIAGQAHIRNGHGIPSRVARRFALWNIAAVQKSVILSSDEPWDGASTDLLFRPK